MSCNCAPCDSRFARKNRRRIRDQQQFSRIDEQPPEECRTAFGGVPLDVPGSVKRNLALKQRDRGFDEDTYLDSSLVLNAAGGDCLEDFDCLLPLKDPLRLAQRGFAVLPGTIQERYFRGDLACDEEELLSWLRNEKRLNRARLLAMPFPQSFQLFADGSGVKHFAVRTNPRRWRCRFCLRRRREGRPGQAYGRTIGSDSRGGVSQPKVIENWYARADSNRRPFAPEA